MRPFFDTNVLVYAFDEGEPGRREVARALIEEHLVEGDGLLSVQVLREFYSVVRRVSFPLPAGAVVEAVRYLAAFSPVPEDAAMVLGAVRRSGEISVSFWDALIVEAALAAGADHLFTEDLQHGQVIEGLRVHDPFLSPG
jgi:predicted nucleic acid-binding protein